MPTMVQPKFSLITRNHTETFLKQRNVFLKRKHNLQPHYQNDENQCEKVTVKSGDEDTQLVRGGDVEEARDGLPPAWADELTSIQFEMADINRKIVQLSSLHDQHLTKSAFDDDNNKEYEIEILTQQITRSFHKCQQNIKLIGQRAKNGSTQQQRMARNIMSSLAQKLQEESTDFKQSQSAYLNRLKGREEREKNFLGVEENYQPGGSDTDTEYFDQRFTNDQIQMVEQNSAEIEQREKEIRNIVESIAELGTVFKDLANLVVDQGSLLDRIDFNMEQTVIKVEDGLQQLVKGEKHQKRGRKCLFILFLALVVLVLIVALCATKLKK